MLRTLLLILALIVLLAGVLVWMGVINIPAGGGGVQVNPVEVKMEPRNVTVPVPTVQPVTPANGAAPR